MRILILGASSSVGSALAAEFAPGNSLVLAGRDGGRLAAAERRCKEAGALELKSVSADLAAGAGPLVRAIGGLQVDLVIDAASSASGSRDEDIGADRMQALVAADLTSKIELLNALLGGQAAAPAVIFVSTVLTRVRSPGRLVYSSLKGLHEAYLGKLRDKRPDLRLLVVHVGAVIDAKDPSRKADDLARAVAKSFRAGRSELMFGLGGRILLGLFYTQPALYLFATLVQRRLRRPKR